MKEKALSKELKVMFHNLFSRIIKPKGKRAFLLSLPKGACLLEVGCGNHSPEYVKGLRPDVFYVGIDVADYNTDEKSKEVADRYVLTTGEYFAETIANMDVMFDGVLSSHNLEHCNHPLETIDAICSRLKVDGRLYLAFPCEKSVEFPSRQGTLNFYDDNTHIYLPILRDVIKRLIQGNNLFIDFMAASYRPLIGRIFGAILDRFIKKRNNSFTWLHYGFETIIWAHKKHS